MQLKAGPEICTITALNVSSIDPWAKRANACWCLRALNGHSTEDGAKDQAEDWPGKRDEECSNRPAVSSGRRG